MAGYTSVTVNGQTVIEGSLNVSIESDDSNRLKYEGGAYADEGTATTKATIEWKTDKGTPATTNKAELKQDNELKFTVEGKVISIPSWDSNWGVVTQCKCTGTISTPS